MKVVGLITEYNPFHNGHKYHIEKAKEITGAEYAVVIMSGNYVQRGTPAIMPKRMRAQMALQNGADAVFELPLCYSTGSAEFFAEGTVSFLEQLGIVDYLCFGSESNDLNGLQKVADILSDEPDEYKRFLQTHLKNGLSFPSARQNALIDYLCDDTLTELVKDPNNILGIEYLKALKKIGSSIQPFTIQRKGAHYHASALEESFSSASAIRNTFSTQKDFATFENVLSDQIPTDCAILLKEHWHTLYPIYPNDFSILLKYRLLEETPESLVQYMDVSEELANRIYKQLSSFLNWEQFCELLKTKELTHTRIQRALLHILLKIKKDEIQYHREHQYHYYARLLGFRKDSAQIISEISKNAEIKLITKLSDTDKLSETAKNMLYKDLFASNIYASVITDKFGIVAKNEYQYPMLKS